MSNPITKTIMESDLKPIEDIIQEVISDGENAKFNIVAYRSKFKYHLLQSQINLIDGFQKHLFSKKFVNPRPPAKLSDIDQRWNDALEDQISSLNETLEFIKKSL